MSALAGQVDRRRIATPGVAVVAAIAAAAWAGSFAVSRGMSSMSGTMGLNLVEFVPAWTLMMAAMMLPAVGVTGSMYARTVVTKRPARLAGFVVGYLAVWAISGLPAFGLAALAGRLATGDATAAHLVAITTFAVCGVYQLTPLKERCLAHCRSPLGQLMRYGSYRGRTRDIRVGLHHGAYCLGCCWALMTILLAVGVMNLIAMVGLMLLIIAEKLFAFGPLTGRLAGVAAIAMAVALIWVPSLAPGLQPMPMT